MSSINVLSLSMRYQWKFIGAHSRTADGLLEYLFFLSCRGAVMTRNYSVKHCHPSSAYLEEERVGALESLLWKQAQH